MVHILDCGGIMVRNLGYRGITVRNLGTGYTLAYKINSETAQVCRANLVKYIRYKASDPIKFGRGKEFISFFGLVQDLFFSLFYQVLFI